MCVIDVVSLRSWWRGTMTRHWQWTSCIWVAGTAVHRTRHHAALWWHCWRWSNVHRSRQVTMPSSSTACMPTYDTVLFFSRPRWSEGWPHHGRTFSIYSCPLSFWLTLPRGVLSTSWCCPSRPACTWHCSLHYFFIALPRSTHAVIVHCLYAYDTVSSLQKYVHVER